METLKENLDLVRHPEKHAGEHSRPSALFCNIVVYCSAIFKLPRLASII